MNKQIQDAILAPYLDNDDDTDCNHYKRIMRAIGKMNQLSSQTIQDVVDELVGELESRS